MRRGALAAVVAAVAWLAAVSAAGAAPPAHADAAAAPPSIAAPSAILVQPDTGDVVYRRNASQERLVASTTKLMTALVTLEHANLGDVYTAIDYPATPGESLMGLRPGERDTVRHLLEGLLLPSGNDAAATLARRVAGSTRAFVRDMNRRARQLGLHDTHYANPIGLDDPRNYSSAEDLVKLSLILLENRFFAHTVNLRHATVGRGARRRTIVNRNTLVQEVPWVDGVKTGHTEHAGYILVGAARRRGVRVLSAVIGDPSEAARDADSLALLRYGLARYRSATPVRRGQVLARPELSYRDRHATLVAGRTAHVVVRRGERAAVRVEGAPAELSGPLPRGARVGTVVISRRGREVARIPLVTAAPVAAATLGDRLGSALSHLWPALLLAVLAACSLPVVLRRRRGARRRRSRARRGRDTETA